MIKMKVSAEDALQELRLVGHARFQSALECNWKIGPDGQPTVQSICWLFCWAKTGQNNRWVAAEAQGVFNRLFDRSFDWFDAHVDHRRARRMRYQKGNLRRQFNRVVGRHGPSFETCVENARRKGALRPYLPTEEFVENEVIAHVMFGPGLVVSSDVDHIVVKFRKCTHQLVHRR